MKALDTMVSCDVIIGSENSREKKAINTVKSVSCRKYKKSYSGTRKTDPNETIISTNL